MLKEIKENLDSEKNIIHSLKNEPNPIIKQSFVNQLRIINLALPELFKKMSPVPQIRDSKINVSKVKLPYGFGKVYVRKDHKALIENEIKVLKNNKFKKKDDKKQKNKNDKKKEDKHDEFLNVKPSFSRNISNRFFRKTSEKLTPKMPDLVQQIKKANLTILPTTYIAMMLFFTTISIFLGIAIYSVLLLINLSFWTYFWIVPVVPLVVFAGFYLYPGSEASGVQKSISYELPFVTIHMTAIAGSDIEPTKIFQIVAQSNEYPNVGKEMQKILVLTQIYGYDLVTSLKNVAARTSNRKFSELLGGLATNISGGGGLKTYLEKKSESYLLDYQLERKRYIDLAGTFMDIYISILIAAPMVLMLMFIIMNVAGLGFQGYSLSSLMILSVVAIVIANILFLVAINLKQPKV